MEQPILNTILSALDEFWADCKDTNKDFNIKNFLAWAEEKERSEVDVS